MSEKKPRKAVVVLAYGAFYITSFLLFCYLTFPYEKLTEFVIAKAEADFGVELEIVDLGPSWLTGVEVEGVRLVKPAEDSSEPPMELLIPEASARVSLLSLLAGNLGGSLEAEIAGGTIDATFERSVSAMALELELEVDSVDLRQLGAVRALAGIPVTGTMSGSADLSLPEDPSEASGEARLSIAGLTIGDGEAKLRVGGMRDGITIETLNLGTLEVEANIAAGEG